MSNRKGQKREVARIDVDWLLGESSVQSVRSFPWFRRIFLSLLCVLAFVWGWPHASKSWLQSEWQHQLAVSKGKQTEDILPILLALNELNPSDNLMLIRQLADSDPNQRKISFQILEKRIQQWGQTARPTAAQWNAMVDAFHSDSIQLPDSIMLRGLLARQLRPLVQSDLPESAKLLASLDAMVEQISIRDSSDSATGTAKNAQVVETPTAVSNTSFRTRTSDSDLRIESQLHPPSLTQPQSRGIAQSTTGPSANNSLAKQTLRDQSQSEGIPHLPNMNLSIPQTVSKAIVPVATVELVEAAPLYRSQEANTMSGYEKLSLGELLPLLTSTQNRIVQQAFNELVHRGLTSAQLEIAVSLAQGNVEQRLQAMETIAKDPNFQESITWLVWMAENADRNVRRRAVVLLGSMTNPDAMRKLRMLQGRESDSAIADQISQVLLASGTASISVR